MQMEIHSCILEEARDPLECGTSHLLLMLNLMLPLMEIIIVWDYGRDTLSLYGA
jgi:hypothetical protein